MTSTRSWFDTNVYHSSAIAGAPGGHPSNRRAGRRIGGSARLTGQSCAEVVECHLTFVLDAVVELGTDHLAANLDDDVMLLNLSTARYHVVGGAGKHIIRILESTDDRPRFVRAADGTLRGR